MKFHIGDIASITTNKLLSPTKMEGIYNILNFLTGDELWTHELPFASDFVKPYLLEQYPKLANINAQNINVNNVQEKVDELIAEYGEYLEITSVSEHWQQQ